MKFHYVYRLISLSHPGRRYVGLTEDLKARLAKHNYPKTDRVFRLLPG
ncbi:MAG: hypothetical protein EA353_11635 [Puniceicoccaceae bacterium]|nr:MAG: hypothetical protein EA353_11635 [Puniceicoccaceae bacterium]